MNKHNVKDTPVRMVRMTIGELALILNISENTVKKLVKTNQLPHLRERNKVLFDFEEILNLFRHLEGEGGAA